MRTLAPLLALWLLPAAARADMLPPGEKAIKLAIHVDAELPAGKVLVLANTFRGADVIKPGEDQAVEWHPMGGAMELRLVAADKVAAIEAAREKLDRDAIKPIVGAGVKCSDEIRGVRTIPDSSPAASLRWTLRAAITADACSSTLVKTEYLSSTGEVVAAPGDPSAIPPPTPPTQEPAKDLPAKAPEPAPAKAAEPAKPAKPAPAQGCGGCDLGGAAGGAPLALLGLLALRRRRAVRA